MSTIDRDTSPTETPPNDNDAPRIGVDEWVAQAEQRHRQNSGWRGWLIAWWSVTPLWGRLGAAVLVLILFPLLTNLESTLSLFDISSNNFIVRIGITFLAFAILAIGLNVVVGYAGLLDLGYVAFFGLAGYAYAYLSSDFIEGGVHVPSLISVPLIILFVAAVGWGLGALSIRLYGDYLAIVTLGFGILLVQLATTLTRVSLPWSNQPVDLTRGPNGINGLDGINLLGYEITSSLQYYYLFLILLLGVIVVVHHLNQSRLGRAWRAMREDELAAEVMGMPTRRLKLMAFAMGAAIAALSGTVFAAWQGNVVPNRYNVLALIELYAMVVLGGTGSLFGVIVGALIFTTLPEILRNPQLAGLLFYAGLLVGLVAWLKFSWRLLAVLGGTLLGAVLFKLVVGAAWPAIDSGIFPTNGSIVNRWVQWWLVIPPNFQLVGNIVIGGAVATLLLTLVLKSPWRWLTLGLSLYMFVFAWETRLAAEPSVTRILIVGTTLVVLMIIRPQGLFGKTQVLIV